MIQQESQNVWGYGRGMARTVARVTYIVPDGVTPDPDNPDFYTTLGPMKFTKLAGDGEWQVDLDVAGPTYIRYAAARILYSSSPGFQAHVTIDDSDPDVPPGSRLRVQVWDVSGGGAPDDAANLEDDAALCIQVIVNQPGEPRYAFGAALPGAPVPAPMPPPPPDDDRPPPRIL